MPTKAFKIIGANGDRRKNDFYPTPPECTVALLEFLENRHLITRNTKIWEPACGENAMVDVMQQRGYNVIGTDIIYDQDYLTTEIDTDQYDWIITNPPFSLAKEFIEVSAKRNKPFALLLKSQFWHAAKRLSIFQDLQPTFVLPLAWRPDFLGKGASLIDVIWVVWIGHSPVTYYLPLKKPKLTLKGR